jgi:RimJ/RimL family protein N-acetyltransferase
MNNAVTFAPLTEAECGEVFNLWSDKEAVIFTNWNYTPDLVECFIRLNKALEYYRKNADNCGPYSVLDSRGKFIGIAGADACHEEPGRFEVWYFLTRESRGKGHGRVILSQLLHKLRLERDATSVTADVVVQNTPSRKMLERAGFKIQRTVVEGFQKHGKKLDLCSYSKDLTDKL